MKKNILKIAGFSLMLALSVSTAQAEQFYWQDRASGASLSFPDSWKQVNNNNPGDVLTIRAPGLYHDAECRLNVQPEGRFKIYPVDYSGEIQRLHISAPYWEEFYATHNDVVFGEVRDNAGLGRGFASLVTARYETAKGARMIKTSMGFASYYNNHIYTLECAAEQSAYADWERTFLSIVQSVDFKKTTDHNYTGYYRDFLSDKTLKIRGATVLDDTYH
jgi:hypothetical protein